MIQGMRNILIVVVIVLIVLFGSHYLFKNEQGMFASEVKLLKKEARENNLDFSFSYPKNIKSFGNPDIEALLELGIDLGKTFMQDLEYANIFNAKYVVFENGRFYSVVLDHYENTGGAHGNSYYYSVVYDRELERVVSLEDVANEVFQESYEELITRLYQKIVKEQVGNLYSDLAYLQSDNPIDYLIKNNLYDDFVEYGRDNVFAFGNKNDLDPQAWYVSKDKNNEWVLNAVFSPYAIGPFSSGTIRVNLGERD